MSEIYTFQCEPTVILPAGGTLLWLPDGSRFGVYDAAGQLRANYSRCSDGVYRVVVDGGQESSDGR